MFRNRPLAVPAAFFIAPHSAALARHPVRKFQHGLISGGIFEDGSHPENLRSFARFGAFQKGVDRFFLK